MKPFILPAMDWIVPLLDFYLENFGIKWPKKVDMPLKKETKLIITIYALSLLFRLRRLNPLRIRPQKVEYHKIAFDGEALVREVWLVCGKSSLLADPLWPRLIVPVYGRIDMSKIGFIYIYIYIYIYISVN